MGSCRYRVDALGPDQGGVRDGSSGRISILGDQAGERFGFVAGPELAKFAKNLVVRRVIGVDESRFVRQILLSHGIAVKVGEIAAIPPPHRIGISNPEQRIREWDR